MMKAGLYIHIPFCLKKCDYCDFYSEITEPTITEQFLNSCANELVLYVNHPVFSEVEFQTFYLGGGTPSLLSARQIEKLANKAQRLFRFSTNLEFTIEANPETLSLSRLKGYRSIGINRLSLGIQSFSDIELTTLGRIHQVEQAKRSIEWAYQAGFDNINLDLIFAIPNQSFDRWQENLERAILFKPKHLSIYGLTIEQGTLLQRNIFSGKLTKASEETERKMYLWSINALSQAGYQQYEISNFAMPGFECKHNLCYWNGTCYLGIGPSAHSYWNSYRQWNTESLKNYLNLLSSYAKPIAGQEELSQHQQILEFIYLSMRTMHGIDMRHFKERFNLSFTKKFKKVLQRLSQYPDGEIFQIQNNNFKLTPQGFVLFDEICQFFADEI